MARGRQPRPPSHSHSAGTATPPPQPTRSSSHARRLKKRETDRKSQRVARDRTKAYIAHLEGVIESFKAKTEFNEVTALVEKLAEVQKERDELSKAMAAIMKVVDAVQGKAEKNGGNTHDGKGGLDHERNRSPRRESFITAESNDGKEVDIESPRSHSEEDVDLQNWRGSPAAGIMMAPHEETLDGPDDIEERAKEEEPVYLPVTLPFQHPPSNMNGQLSNSDYRDPTTADIEIINKEMSFPMDCENITWTSLTADMSDTSAFPNPYSIGMSYDSDVYPFNLLRGEATLAGMTSPPAWDLPGSPAYLLPQTQTQAPSPAHRPLWPVSQSTTANVTHPPPPPSLNPSNSIPIPQTAQASTLKSCPCSSTSPNSVPNLWRLSNILLTSANNPSTRQAINRSTPLYSHLDEHIAISAILYGWNTPEIENLIREQPSWQIAKTIDERVFGYGGCAPLERLVIVWAVQTMLREKAAGDSSDGREGLPGWYKTKPEKASSISGSYAVNFFAWPGVRNRFYHSEHKYCTNRFWSALCKHFRVSWPYDFRAVYNSATPSPMGPNQLPAARFSLTREFTDRLQDLATWRVEKEFFDVWPEMRGDIGIVGGGVIPKSLDTLGAAEGVVEREKEMEWERRMRDGRGRKRLRMGSGVGSVY